MLMGIRTERRNHTRIKKNDELLSVGIDWAFSDCIDIYWTVAAA